MSDSSQPYGLWPTRLLCPWNFQARTLEWVVLSSSGGSSQPRDHASCVSCTAGGFLLLSHHGSPDGRVSKYLKVKWSEVKWSHSVVSNSLQPHGLEPTRLLHPWHFPESWSGLPLEWFLSNQDATCQEILY